MFTETRFLKQGEVKFERKGHRHTVESGSFKVFSWVVTGLVPESSFICTQLPKHRLFPEILQKLSDGKEGRNIQQSFCCSKIAWCWLVCYSLWSLTMYILLFTAFQTHSLWSGKRGAWKFFLFYGHIQLMSIFSHSSRNTWRNFCIPMPRHSHDSATHSSVCPTITTGLKINVAHSTLLHWVGSLHSTTQRVS